MKAQYIITVTETTSATGEPYFIGVMAEAGTGKEIAWGSGKTGPLDAASSVATVASNKEFAELQLSGM